MVRAPAFDDRETPLGRVLDAANVSAWEWEIATDRVTSRAPAPGVFARGEHPTTLAGCLALLHPDDRPAVRAALVAAVERDVPVDTAFRVRCPGGVVRRMVARGRVARDAAGRAVRVAGVALEADARPRDDEEHGRRIKDEVLAMVTHELRGPMQTTVMWAHVLRKPDADETARSRASAGIEESIRLQRRLLDDLADVTRLVTGKLVFDLQTVDAASTIAAVLDVVRPDAVAKGVAIETAFDREGAQVIADPDRLRQVAWNLVANAVKFTPAGGCVTVRVRRAEETVEIVVQDTGDGIAREMVPHVFEPFRQADRLGTGTGSGLGLGLAIVRHLVEAHGGTVHAESAGVGQGAAFTVRLPALL